MIEASDDATRDTKKESLPQRGLEPLSSHSEDQFQYLNLSGGVLRRVWLITFARGKVTNI